MARKPEKIKQSRAVQEAVKYLKTARFWKKPEMAQRGIIYTYANGQFELAPIGKAAFDVLADEARTGEQKNG